MNLSNNFKENMKIILKDEYEDFLNCFGAKAKKGLRINTTKIEDKDLMSLLNIDLKSVPWCKNGYYYPEDFRPAKNFCYNAGLYYIQEPSAMIVGSIIPIEKGDKVLDLCAAPGGKTTHIGARLDNTGLIVSNDISASRCKALLKNVELMGIKNVTILTETANRLASKFTSFFDKIVIDAPCSGEGMFRKSDMNIKEWSIENIDKYSKVQKEILEDAEKMLSPGGIISYSTCTFNTKENEEVITWFLNKHKDFKLLPIDHSYYSVSTGISDDEFHKDIRNCARIWPHKNNGEGHFLALLQKTGDKVEKFKSNINNNNFKEALIFKKFCNENGINFKPKNLILHKNSLFEVPEDLIDLDGLRIVRNGWYLGNIEKDRFKPSQAFAMGLDSDYVSNVIKFPLENIDIERYLKGESFEVSDANEGFNLVCLNKFPIGWSKVIKGRLKNKCAKGFLIN